MRLLKNLFYNTFYQLLIIFLPIVTWPYISRVLGPSLVGINSYTYSIISYFVLIGSIGLQIYGNREIAYVQSDFSKRTQIFWEVVILRFLTIGIVIFLFFLFLLFPLKVSKTYYIIQAIAILAAAFDISWFFLGMEEFKKIVIVNTIIKLFSLFLIFTFVKTSSDLWKYILINTASILVANLSLWPLLRRSIGLPHKRLFLLKHLKSSLLLFFPQVATQIYLVVNKNMLGLLDSMSSVGYFEQSDSVIRVILSIATSLGTVMMPHIAKMKSEGNFEQIDKIIIKSFNLLTGISFPLAMGMIAVARPFVCKFFGDQFIPSISLMMIEAIIIVFISWSNVLGVQYLLPMNLLNEFTISVTLGAIFNIILNIVFIPLFGTIGAAISTVISEIIVTMYQLWVVSKNFKISLFFYELWKYLLASIVMFITVYILTYMLTISTINLLFEIIIGFCIYVIIIFILKTSLVSEFINLFQK